MFLTEEAYEAAVRSLKGNLDCPYILKPEHPLYGQLLDE
jgi:hypothetical protein